MLKTLIVTNLAAACRGRSRLANGAGVSSARLTPWQAGAQRAAPLPFNIYRGRHGLTARGFVTEKLLTFRAQETADYRDAVIALAKNELARNEARSPLVIIRAALASIRRNVFLRDAVNHRANPGPHASAGTHRARLVRRVQNEVGEVPAISTANVFQR